MATKLATSKDDGRNQVEAYNSEWRDGEQALLRLTRNTAERGDGIRLAKVGLNDPGRQATELERLGSVSTLLAKSGTAKEFQKTRDEFHETEPRCRAGLEHCETELTRLNELRAAVVGDRNRLEAELSNATNALDAMVAARLRLQSPTMLPSHVVAELNARRNAVANETIERRRELSELISTLNGDAGRLDKQTEHDGFVRNEVQLEEFASRAANNVMHRGHSFWEPRVFSLSEWRNYEAWASARAADAQVELDELKSAAASKLADEVEELSGFYANAIE